MRFFLKKKKKNFQNYKVKLVRLKWVKCIKKIAVYELFDVHLEKEKVKLNYIFVNSRRFEKKNTD